MSYAARPRLDPSWEAAVGGEFDQPYMRALAAFLDGEAAAGKRIFPEPALVYAALELTPLSAVRAVVIGQDPYHGSGQAHGLAFSVRPGTRPPPSLRNVFKELRADLGIAPPGHGSLVRWAERGVLLLNTVLTVEEGQAGSHRGRGWERLTDAVIRAVSDRRDAVAFVAWGLPARRKADLVDGGRHEIVSSAHPSPLSASRGFLGSRPFSKVNAFLERRGQAPIDWRLD
ncbi:uracil-DNA glycosylase [Arenibaculum sp.]|uniref:uracil-DNA glycosylase n=1 Tax=Arenibaculum sp. TaxID=2865862 RepID=UPI002E13998C|nr:uracil-DNA glycosylase [Arenibaculum sp.]